MIAHRSKGIDALEEMNAQLDTFRILDPDLMKPLSLDVQNPISLGAQGMTHKYTHRNLMLRIGKEQLPPYSEILPVLNRMRREWT